jgi:hypothetical protein
VGGPRPPRGAREAEARRSRGAQTPLHGGCAGRTGRTGSRDRESGALGPDLLEHRHRIPTGIPGNPGVSRNLCPPQCSCRKSCTSAGNRRTSLTFKSLRSDCRLKNTETVRTPGNPGNATGVQAPAALKGWLTSRGPDVPLSENHCPVPPGISLHPDTALYNSNAGAVPHQLLTLYRALIRPAATGLPRKATGGRVRPAVRSRATFRSEGPDRPEPAAGVNCGRHTGDQPEAGACPRPGRPTARPRPPGGGIFGGAAHPPGGAR